MSMGNLKTVCIAALLVSVAHSLPASAKNDRQLKSGIHCGEFCTAEEKRSLAPAPVIVVTPSDNGIEGPFENGVGINNPDLGNGNRIELGGGGGGGGAGSPAQPNPAVQVAVTKLEAKIADFAKYDKQLVEATVTAGQKVTLRLEKIADNEKLALEYQDVIDDKEENFNETLKDGVDKIVDGFEREFKDVVDLKKPSVSSKLKTARDALDAAKAEMDALQVYIDAEAAADKIKDLERENENLRKEIEEQNSFKSRYEAARRAIQKAIEAAASELAELKTAEK